ncbi:MAG: hypothetical protein ABSF88_01235 [Candidatus Aminicenantales bacterium]
MAKIKPPRMIDKRTIGCSAAVLVLLSLSLLSSCVTARFTEPITSFRDCINASSLLIGSYYTELNNFEREIYLDERLYGSTPEEMTVSLTNNGKPTALLGPFSAKSIAARTDAIVLLGTYAQLLGDLAGSDAPQQFSEGAKILGDNLFNLQTTFEKLGAVGDSSAKNYFGPVGTIIGVIGNIYLNGVRDAQIKIAIEKGAPAVRNVLSLLEKDFIDVITPLQSTGLKEELSLRMGYYNSRLNSSFEQRKQMLAEIGVLVARYDTAMNANPVNLIQTMRAAHESLVKYAESPKGLQTFAEFLSALETFKNHVQELSTAINQIRDLKKGE